MKYIVYWNHTNKHVYIHTSQCSSVHQHGGNHVAAQGGYSEWNTYNAAHTQANTDAARIGVIARDCQKCKPVAHSGLSSI